MKFDTDYILDNCIISTLKFLCVKKTNQCIWGYFLYYIFYGYYMWSCYTFNFAYYSFFTKHYVQKIFHLKLQVERESKLIIRHSCFVHYNHSVREQTNSVIVI